jgi:hypothetical protein
MKWATIMERQKQFTSGLFSRRFDEIGLKARSERQLIDPTPELPDNTLIENIRFPTRIRNVLAAAGLRTVGEVREIADETLLSFQDLGQNSVDHLRKNFGLPSTDVGQAAVRISEGQSFKLGSVQIRNVVHANEIEARVGR